MMIRRFERKNVSKSWDETVKRSFNCHYENEQGEEEEEEECDCQ